jgi:hypothetical protein
MRYAEGFIAASAFASIRFSVRGVSGQVSATKSACGKIPSRSSSPTTSSAAPAPFDGSRRVAITRISKALASFASRDPIRP